MHLTEKEQLEAQQQNLVLIEQQIKNQKFSIKEFSEFVPGMLHLNSFENASIVFVDDDCQKYFDLSHQQMLDLKEKFLFDCYHSTTYEILMPKLVDFAKKKDYNKVLGSFQQMRKTKHHEFEKFVGFSKLSKELNSIISIQNPTNIFGDAMLKMNKLVDDNEFLRKNFKKFASLSKREIEVLKLVGLGESRSHISTILNISKHTFDNHRKNIRKKLCIQNSADLFKYIRAFDLL